MNRCCWELTFNKLHTEKSDCKVCTWAGGSWITHGSNKCDKLRLMGKMTRPCILLVALISNQYLWRLQNVHLMLQSHLNFCPSPSANMVTIFFIPTLHGFSAGLMLSKSVITGGYVWIDLTWFLLARSQLDIPLSGFWVYFIVSDWEVDLFFSPSFYKETSQQHFEITWNDLEGHSLILNMKITLLVKYFVM